MADTSKRSAILPHDPPQPARSLAKVVSRLDAEALNWKPGDETNSIAVLVSHGLDAERFCVASSVDVTLDRDREAKFRTQVSSADDLLAVIDESEREVDGYLDSMTADSLSSEVTRGDRTRTGAWWVLHSLDTAANTPARPSSPVSSGSSAGKSPLTLSLLITRC